CTANQTWPQPFRASTRQGDDDEANHPTHPGWLSDFSITYFSLCGYQLSGDSRLNQLAYISHRKESVKKPSARYRMSQSTAWSKPLDDCHSPYS
ncbi:hypothetical protein, partial [Pseudomonas putida]|uniref:hypothetical protein n=1 Tax=Pseudomonas putida TaxID=303 RepID=UPI001ED969F9